MNDTCVCGHVLDEHEATPLAACAVEGCLCGAFEADPDDGEDQP